MRTLTIDKESDGSFVVHERSLPGSPYVGRGRTYLEAIANWTILYQREIGVEFEVAPAAQAAEQRRRRKAMASR